MGRTFFLFYVSDRPELRVGVREALSSRFRGPTARDEVVTSLVRAGLTWSINNGMAALLVVLRCSFDLIMACHWLDFGKKLPGFRLKDGNSVIRSSKCSHGLQRVKHVHHHKFDLIASLLSQDVTASITIDPLEARKNALSEQFLVGIGVLKRCPASPQACNHLI